MIKYNVWVGGSQVNEYELTLDEADNLTLEYLEDDYDDIWIEVVKGE
jgi:hypothetical protein